MYVKATAASGCFCLADRNVAGAVQQKELLSPGRGGMLAEDKRVVVQMSRGQAHLPDLTVTGAAQFFPTHIILPCPIPLNRVYSSASLEEISMLCFALHMNAMLPQEVLLCVMSCYRAADSCPWAAIQVCPWDDL